MVMSVLFSSVVVVLGLILSMQHTLKCLILLEALVLMSILAGVSLWSGSGSGSVILISVLTLSVMGASLGLSLLTSLSRSHASDFTLMSSLTW